MKNNSKHFLTVLVLSMLLLSSCCNDKQKKNSEEEQSSTEIVYDSINAKKYGADQYGMKKYVMAFLKRGPNRSLDEAKANELQMAHLNNINRMAEEGKLVLAGPFYGDGDMRGIYIFNVETIAEAEALTNSDPAIQAGSLVMELKEWYGSAALVPINDIHKTLSRRGITE